MEEPEGLGLADYLGILRRRRWYLILPAILIFAVAGVVAVLMPATYRSEATILIEQQQIPEDLVRTTVTSYADQRVQVISQRVMTTANLSPILDKYGLYRQEREKTPVSALLETMRENIGLEMLSADVVDPRSGSAKKATIAFTLAFDSPSPTTAQKVTNELVSLFLNENLRKRREAAEETSAFLTAEAERLAGQISDLEAKVARFKEAHGENLPEMQTVNAQFLQRTEDQLERNELEARLLDERIVFIEAELGRTSRYGESERDGNQRVITPKERLVQLELQYLELATRAKEKHPDLRLLEREIRALRVQTGGLSADDLEGMLEQARAALAERRQEFAEDHPDVKGAVRAVAALEEQLQAVRAGGAGAMASQLPENPAYLRLQGQLEAVRKEREFLQKKRTALSAELVSYEERVKEGPKIEREYRALTRDYENAIAKYREIKAKEMEAELAESLESERKAERFVLIEPPLVPSKPIKPNRLAIVFLGFVFSVGGGVGAVVLREGTSQGLHGSKAVAAVMGAPPLAVIPYIVTDEEKRKNRRRRILILLGVTVLLAGAVAAVHYLYRPLDLIWLQVLQRFGLA